MREANQVLGCGREKVGARLLLRRGPFPEFAAIEDEAEGPGSQKMGHWMLGDPSGGGGLAGVRPLSLCKDKFPPQVYLVDLLQLKEGLWALTCRSKTLREKVRKAIGKCNQQMRLDPLPPLRGTQTEHWLYQ